MSESTLPARLADARARRARWCHEARVLGQIAFEADASRAPLSAPAGGRASALLTAAWERRAGLWSFDASAIGPLPDWADCPRERRQELAVLAGAVLCARALRQCIDGSVLIPLRVTRAQLASLVGATVETTIRTLSRWHRDGHIVSDELGIVIKHPAQLASLAGAEETVGPEGSPPPGFEV